jgi:O-antigen/teichoic acid export membrane protein
MPSYESTLKHRVLKGGVWSLGGHGANQLIRFASNLVMTRLLVPDMFGVMAIAMLVFVGLSMLSDLGLKQSVIQSDRGAEPAFLDTVWILQICRGVLLCIGALGVALSLAYLARIGFFAPGSVYSNPSLPSVVAALSVVPILSGLQSTKVLQANREIALSQLTKMELVAQVIGIASMFIWAAVDRSIWCLIIGQILSLLVLTTMSHLWMPGTSNRWQWDQDAARQIVHFGKWIMASSLLGFLVSNGDRLLLGALVTPQTLGVYVIAFSIFTAIEQVITKLISDLAFPALSEIRRSDPSKFLAGHYRFLTFLAPFSYVCAGTLIVAGQSIIDVLYDPRYKDAGWMLQLLAIALITMPFRLSATSLLALGFSRSFFALSTLRVLTLFSLLPIGFMLYGVPGAIVGIVLSQFAPVPMNLAYAIRHGFIDFRKEAVMLLSLFIGMLSGGAIKFVLNLM